MTSDTPNTMVDKVATLMSCLSEQKTAYDASPYPSYQERREHLLALKNWVLAHKEDIISAICQDYGNRSRTETLMFEIFPILSGIDFVLKRLKRWLRPQKRHVDLMNFLGASNHVIPQPLGVVGIVVPWNFPLFLSLSPLTYAFAAGNRAMIKMSINASNLANLMVRTFPTHFSPEKLKVFSDPGGWGRAFTQLPFDHLLFTGSEATGKQVMAAASANLCPVTLELGGKSPALICPDFPLKTALERLLFVKYANAGQICVTVDHVYINETRVPETIELAKKIVRSRYTSIEDKDFTAIIDLNRFQSLVAMLNEAKEKGATLIPLLDGPSWDESTKKINPHLVINAPPDSQLMQEEIFGPILPIIKYAQIEDAVKAIKSCPQKPLAFYPFTYQTDFARRLIQSIPSGGVSVNDALFHVAQHDLPFGGVGSSGMGHYHGQEGFATFSKLRPIFYQARFPLTPLLFPPYRKFSNLYLRFLTRK